jgi:hypothetical protein
MKELVTVVAMVLAWAKGKGEAMELEWAHNSLCCTLQEISKHGFHYHKIKRNLPHEKCNNSYHNHQSKALLSGQELELLLEVRFVKARVLDP